MAAPAPIPPERKTLDAAGWERVSAMAVHRAFQLVNRGEFRPPVTITFVDEESVIGQIILPDLTGAVELGPLHPLRQIARPVYMPISIRFSDSYSDRVFEGEIDFPPAQSIQ